MSPTQYIHSEDDRKHVSIHEGPHTAPDIDHKTLIKNISIFNGTKDELATGKDVVLRDKTGVMKMDHEMGMIFQLKNVPFTLRF